MHKSALQETSSALWFADKQNKHASSGIGHMLGSFKTPQKKCANHQNLARNNVGIPPNLAVAPI